MAASTLKGEETPVLTAFAALRRVQPSAMLIIAPRKPERFGEAEALARAEGFRVMRRTELAVDAEPRADVVVLDSIGELAHLFQVATVVFVGGSLVDQGGHNILEPAVHGKPIVFGPHMQNFAEIAATFLTSQAAIQVSERVGADRGRPAAGRRSGRARAARRGGARAGRSQPRRQTAHARGDLRSAPRARRPRRREAVQAWIGGRSVFHRSDGGQVSGRDLAPSTPIVENDLTPASPSATSRWAGGARRRSSFIWRGC